MSRSEWHMGALVREAFLNVFAASPRGMLPVFIAVSFGAGTVTFSAYEAHILTTRLDTLEKQGSTVVVFQATKRSSGDNFPPFMAA